MTTPHAEPTRAVCGAPKADGTTCRSSFGLGASGRCLAHDPDRRELSRASRAAGGRAAGIARREKRDAAKAQPPANVPPVMRSLDDAVAVAAWITDGVLRGTIDARTAEAATKSVRQFQLGEEKATLLARIKALEAQLKLAGRAP